MTTQEMIERYIYDVARRLPVSQREDIQRELRTLIDDMLEERAENGKTQQENVEDVLRQLGSPSALAGKYRDEKRYLIGPEYYEQYCFVLKIVLIAVTIGMVIAAIVQGIAQETTWTAVASGFAEGNAAAGTAPLIGNIALAVGTAIGNIIMGLIQGFAWVTLLFAVVERCAKGKMIPMGEWKPADLPPVPQRIARIKRGDSIAGIVFTVAVIILFNFIPYAMSLYWLEDGVVHVVPLFNIAHLQTVLVFLNICFALGILREVLRVAVGRHTLPLGMITLVINMVSLWLACIVFFDPGIWNADLIAQSASFVNIAEQAGTLTMFWGYFTKYFGFILVFAFVLDSALSLYKGIRYGR